MLKNNRKIGLWLLFAIMTLLFSFPSSAEPAFSEFWYQDTAGWHVKDGNGNLVKNAWLCDDAVGTNGKDVWYLIDADGNMISAGLVQDGTGNYYSLEMNHVGHYGMLRYQSGTYTADGLTVDLTLESAHNGSFAAIRNEAGISALKAKYGLKKVSVDNSNCVYTSSFGKTAARSSVSQTANGGALTEADFQVTGASVPAKDLMVYLNSQGGSDRTVYFFYSSSSDPSREGVVKTARGITLASYKSDVVSGYGEGREVDLSDPAGTKVIRNAYSADASGIRNFVKSCLAYFTEDGKYAIYFGFKENGQCSFIFYHKV